MRIIEVIPNTPGTNKATIVTGNPIIVIAVTIPVVADPTAIEETE